jgi:glutamate/aspartate transport system substrate-binding protein
MTGRLATTVVAALLGAFAFSRPLYAEDMEGADLTAPPPAAEAPLNLVGTLAKVRDSGTITLGYRAAALPFSYVSSQSKTGEPIGYSIDLCLGVVDEIRRELQGSKLTVAYVEVTSENRVGAVAGGKIDIECGTTTDNLGRRRAVSFSPVIFVAGTKLMAKRGSGIRSLRDLEGKKLVVTAGTTNERALVALNNQHKLGLDIVSAADHPASFDMLVSGKADAFAADDVLLSGLIASRNAGATMEVVGDFLTYEPYGLMYRKDDAEMAQAVNNAFAAMAVSGKWAAIYRKWFVAPTPTGEAFDLPMSLQLTEAMRAMGAEGF